MHCRRIIVILRWDLWCFFPKYALPPSGNVSFTVDIFFIPQCRYCQKNYNRSVVKICLTWVAQQSSRRGGDLDELSLLPMKKRSNSWNSQVPALIYGPLRWLDQEKNICHHWCVWTSRPLISWTLMSLTNQQHIDLPVDFYTCTQCSVAVQKAVKHWPISWCNECACACSPSMLMGVNYNVGAYK